MRSSGIGIGTVVFIVLLALKLTIRPEIGWLWVFAPLWISAILLVVGVILSVVISVIASSRLND